MWRLSNHLAAALPERQLHPVGFLVYSWMLGDPLDSCCKTGWKRRGTHSCWGPSCLCWENKAASLETHILGTCRWPCGPESSLGTAARDKDTINPTTKKNKRYKPCVEVSMVSPKDPSCAKPMAGSLRFISERERFTCLTLSGHSPSLEEVNQQLEVKSVFCPTQYHLKPENSLTATEIQQKPWRNNVCWLTHSLMLSWLLNTAQDLLPKQ